MDNIIDYIMEPVRSTDDKWVKYRCDFGSNGAQDAVQERLYEVLGHEGDELESWQKWLSEAYTPMNEHQNSRLSGLWFSCVGAKEHAQRSINARRAADKLELETLVKQLRLKSVEHHALAKQFSQSGQKGCAANHTGIHIGFNDAADALYELITDEETGLCSTCNDLTEKGQDYCVNCIEDGRTGP